MLSLKKSVWLLLSTTIFLFPALILTVNKGLGYALLPMLIICLIAIIYKNKHLFSSWDKTDYIFTAVLLIYPTSCALSMLLNNHWQWDSFDNPARFLLALPIYLVIRKYGFSQTLFYLGLAAGAIGAGLLGYQQKFILGLEHAHGFTHKIPFGDISLLLGALASTYLIKNNKSESYNKLLALIIIIAIPFGILGSICSGTRGGWIAMPFMAWLVLSTAVHNKKILWPIYASFIALLITVYFGNNFVQNKIDRAVTTTIDYFAEDKIRGSAGTRFEMWRAAGIIFQEKPLFGHGVHSYKENLTTLMEKDVVNPGRPYAHAHNELLNLLAELGVIGGLIFFTLFILPILILTKLRSVNLKYATAGLLLCLGYIEFGLTQVMLHHSVSSTFFAFMLALLAGVVIHSRNLSTNQ